MSSEDGKLVIFNGKHVAQALLVVRDQYRGLAPREAGSTAEGSAGSTAGEEAWATDALVKIFNEGLMFAVYEFPGAYSHLRHQSAQALSHEEEQNKLYHTTLAQKAKLVRAYYARERMGWAKAQAALTAELGLTKARTVARWVVLARDFSDDVMNHLAGLGLKSLPQSFVVNNRYLTGKNAEARYRLGDEWAKVAFTWLRAAKDSGVSVNVESFVSDYCVPAKHAESWVRAQVQIFGLAATGFRAFARAVEKLQSESGRRNVITWMSSPELKQRKHFALEELVALVEEMQKTKAGTNKSAAGSSAADAADGGSPSGGVAGSDAAGAAGSTAAEEHDGDVGLLDDEEPAVDPVLEKAQAMAASEMAPISIHTDATAFADELKSTIYASSRPLVVIECPTSRQSTYFALLERLSDIPAVASYGLLIPLGNRDELIGSLRGFLRKRFPGRAVFLVTLSVGKQTARIRPSYILYMPHSADIQAAAHVGIEGCRARASEGIRLRCTTKSCPHRQAGSAAGTEADAEIAAEDLRSPISKPASTPRRTTRPRMTTC